MSDNLICRCFSNRLGHHLGVTCEDYIRLGLREKAVKEWESAHRLVVILGS